MYFSRWMPRHQSKRNSWVANHPQKQRRCHQSSFLSEPVKRGSRCRQVVLFSEEEFQDVGKITLSIMSHLTRTQGAMKCKPRQNKNLNCIWSPPPIKTYWQNCDEEVKMMKRKNMKLFDDYIYFKIQSINSILSHLI